MGHIINYNPEDIQKEKHICYFTEDSGTKIKLFEVIELFITHDSDNQMLFSRIETRLVKEDYRNRMPEAHLLESAQNNIKKTHKC